MRLLTRAAVAAGLFVTVACARYEYRDPRDVPGACPAHTAAPEPPAARVGATGGRVTGRVVGADGLGPIVGARVRVVWPLPQRHAETDTLGRYALDSLAPGEYAISAAAIGYRPVERRVTAGADSGPALDFVLSVNPLDGICSGIFLARVRKPWWKLW